MMYPSFTLARISVAASIACDQFRSVPLTTAPICIAHLLRKKKALARFLSLAPIRLLILARFTKLSDSALNLRARLQRRAAFPQVAPRPQTVCGDTRATFHSSLSASLSLPDISLPPPP